MLAHTQEQFFVLLRAGLWDTPVSPTELGTPIDWPGIYRIAREQTVTGLIADAIGTLPAAQRPPMPVLQRFIMDKLAIEKSHIQLNAVLNEVVQALNANGIPHVLLKGQGVAQNYPHPTSRTCGDIDLYVGEENYAQANEVILAIPGAEDGPECEHHRHIDLKGVTLEIHRKADMMEPASIDRKFQQWTIEQLDANFTHPEHLSQWDNNGTTISRATPTFDALFILSHMFRHMIHGGVGLRQLTDWTMYLHAHHQDVDRNKLLRILKITNLTKTWEAFGSTAVRYMGLNANELVLSVQVNEKLADKVMRQILISGNFGRADEVQRGEIEENYLKRKLHSFTFRLRRMCILSPMFPKYITVNFFGWISGAIGRIFRHE